MRYLILAFIVALLTLPHSRAAAQDAEPGALYIATPSPLITGGSMIVCACRDVYELYLEARVPEAGAEGVRFEISWDGFSTDPVSAELVDPDFVDVSSPGDNVWDIHFDHCLEPNSYVRLLALGELPSTVFGACTTGSEVPVPVWTLCSGETQAGPLYHYAAHWSYFEDGCFYDDFHGPISNRQESWSVLRSRY